MTDDKHLTDEVSIEGRITASGLSVKAKSRTIAAIDRLMGAMINVPASKMEACATRLRNQTRLESTIYDVAVERVGETTEARGDATRLINELVSSQIEGIANKKYVIERTVEYLVQFISDRGVEPEADLEQVDPDWINFFGRYAEQATSENVRDLWARVLAGEIRHPTSFSRATLRFLAELDNRMASWFEQEMMFRVGGKYIPKPTGQSGEQVARLAFLEEVGLIQYASPVGGMVRTLSPNSNGYAVIFEGDMCLRIQIERDVNLSIIPITRIGQEICRIFPPVDQKAVLKRVAEKLHGEVISMDICRILPDDDHAQAILPPIEILKSGIDDSD